MNTRSILTLIALAVAGCAKDSAWPLFSQSRPPPQVNLSMLQEDLMSFADRFSSAVADAYDQAANNAISPRAEDLALSRKTSDLAAAIAKAVDDNPLAGLLDMMVMTSLSRAIAEAPWFKETFGDSAAAAIAAVYKQQEDDIWQIATQYLTLGQLAELRESIDRWLIEHPDQRQVAMVRLADFSRAKQARTGKGGAGSVFGLLFLDPLSGLDPAVREVELARETAQRMFYYLQRMPWLLAWQAELSARRSLGAPQVESLLQSTTDVSATIKAFPQILTEERQRAIEQAAEKIAEQRDGAIRQAAASVATERDAAIKQIAAAVATERQAVLAEATTRVSGEREAALQHVGSVLQSERAALIRDVDATTKGLIDRVLWGQVIVVLISAVAVVVAALVYRKLRPN